MRKSEFETPFEQPPETSPEEWEALEGGVSKRKPYDFGDIYSEKDREHDINLCPHPDCGLKGKLQPLPLELPIKGILKCPGGHFWALNSKTGAIEEVSEEKSGERQKKLKFDGE